MLVEVHKQLLMGLQSLTVVSAEEVTRDFESGLQDTALY
jgi:hypothetical protein